MTPKGVEHCTGAWVSAAITMVSESMTPKGVEHLTFSRLASNDEDVSESMTPKGVEHTVRTTSPTWRQQFLNL